MIEKNIAELEAEIAILRKVRDLFPDVTIHTNRWNRKRFSSPSVNAKATRIKLLNSCGCCSDSPLFANPCMDIEGGITVYGDLEICIGEGNIWDQDWEERLKSHHVSQSAIDSIRYLAKFEEE